MTPKAVLFIATFALLGAGSSEAQITNLLKFRTTQILDTKNKQTDSTNLAINEDKAEAYCQRVANNQATKQYIDFSLRFPEAYHLESFLDHENLLVDWIKERAKDSGATFDPARSRDDRPPEYKIIEWPLAREIQGYVAYCAVKNINNPLFTFFALGNSLNVDYKKEKILL